MDLLDRDAGQAAVRSSAYRDDVLPDLAAWSGKGEACALVTLIGVDGNAPRAEGAQMAVSESGEWAGYISGGCLEQAIALEAVAAIKAGKPKLLRYGKGSPFFDIRLPCGSGLDVFILPALDAALIQEMYARLERRQPFALRIGLASGSASLEPAAPGEQSSRDGEDFLRVYTPPLRCLVIGSSPVAVKLAELAASAGFETAFYAPDAETLPPFPAGVSVHPLPLRPKFSADPWTAAVLAFHDHEKEMPVFAALIDGPCFFITAIGSRNAHAARKLALASAGFSETAIACIQSPAGLVPGLKSASLVALSILAQIVDAARERHIVS